MGSEDIQPTTPLPANTTAQQDIVTAGQRKVNLIWERTQSVVAIAVVLITMSVSSYGYIVGNPKEVPNIIAAAFGMIVGFYFARTNHQAIGGTGDKADRNQEYRGR